MRQRSPLFMIAAMVATIAAVGVAKHYLTAAKCENQIVTMSLPRITLPYKTEDGTSLSMDGIPRGRFEIPPGSEITQIELSAIMLDPQQNLIKQVLMIGGNFPDNAEFEFTDRFHRKVIKPAKVIDRITVQPGGSNTNFIYLFAPPQPGRWDASKIVSVELDDSFFLSNLSVRRANAPSPKWIEGRFMPTNEKIRAKYAFRNQTVEGTKATYVYGVSDDCPKN